MEFEVQRPIFRLAICLFAFRLLITGLFLFGIELTIDTLDKIVIVIVGFLGVLQTIAYLRQAYIWIRSRITMRIYRDTSCPICFNPYDTIAHTPVGPSCGHVHCAECMNRIAKCSKCNRVIHKRQIRKLYL
jgi:hypothetical protein